MNNHDIVLIGAGGHAKACIDVIEMQGRYRIVGLVARLEELKDRRFGYSVIATDDELADLALRHPYAFIAVGQITSPDIRIRLHQRALQAGFRLPAIVSPTASVSPHASIGVGSIVMHGAIVNAGASVGDNCIVNTRALIEHDVIIDDHCHVATGAIVNGGANIGRGSFIGSGCVIKEGVTLGTRCLVGMGLSVRHDQPDDVKLAGGGS